MSVMTCCTKRRTEQGVYEMILDCRAFKEVGIEVMDIAKRLIDYGFHAPTHVVAGAGNVDGRAHRKRELGGVDRFAEAMLSIREEIAAIERGEADKEDNVLKMAPIPWKRPRLPNGRTPTHVRRQCTYKDLRANKFWSAVRAVDNAYGDRNLVCSCPHFLRSRKCWGEGLGAGEDNHFRSARVSQRSPYFRTDLRHSKT